MTTAAMIQTKRSDTLTAVFVIAAAAPWIVVNCESCERSGCSAEACGAGVFASATPAKLGASVSMSARSAVSVVAGTRNRVTLDTQPSGHPLRGAGEQGDEKRIHEDEQPADDDAGRLPHQADERLQAAEG